MSRANLALVLDGDPVSIEERIDVLDEGIENVDQYALGLDRRLRAVEGRVDVLDEKVEKVHEHLGGEIW